MTRRRILHRFRPDRKRLRLFVNDVAILAGLAAIIAVLVVSFGLYNVSARLGHLPGVGWALNTTFKHSVSLWAALDGVSADKDAPFLSDIALVQRGAGHYEGGCAPCHAAPGRRRNRIVRMMEPAPPHIAEVAGDWSADELFWLVKHGAKMTGMPQWPSRVRDDDVWSVVAFLLTVEGMDGEAYRRLAFGEAAPASVREDAATLAGLGRDPDDRALDLCIRCHGRDGRGRGTGAFPRLDILSEDYLFASLLAYATGERHSGIMQPIAEALTIDEMQKVADHYSGRWALAEPSPIAPNEPALIAAGRAIAVGGGRQGPTGDDVPACAACHGPWPSPRRAAYPNLAGQHPNYLFEQLQAFKEGVRGGAIPAHLMDPVIERLSEEEMRAVAAFYASLTAER